MIDIFNVKSVTVIFAIMAFIIFNLLLENSRLRWQVELYRNEIRRIVSKVTGDDTKNM